MSKVLGGINWFLVFMASIGAALVITGFGDAIGEAAKGQWLWVESPVLRLILTFLIVTVVVITFTRTFGSNDLTEEKVLKLLEPGAELELIFQQNGLGVLLAQHFLAIDGKAIELPDFYRETLEHVSKTWSWAYVDNRIRFTVKGHLTPSVYPDFFRELAQKIIKSSTKIKPQVVVSKAGQITLIKT